MTSSGADPHTTAGKLANLERRRSEAVHAGSQQAVDNQHERGKKTARERIEALLDPGSFTEVDELARHRSTDFGIEARGRSATAWSPGTAPWTAAGVRVQPGLHGVRRRLGEVYGEKIVKIMDTR